MDEHGSNEAAQRAAEGGDSEDEEDEVCVCVLSIEEKRSALLDNLDLYPSSGLRFIEEDVLGKWAPGDVGVWGLAALGARIGLLCLNQACRHFAPALVCPCATLIAVEAVLACAAKALRLPLPLRPPHPAWPRESPARLKANA